MELTIDRAFGPWESSNLPSKRRPLPRTQHNSVSFRPNAGLRPPGRARYALAKA